MVPVYLTAAAVLTAHGGSIDVIWPLILERTAAFTDLGAGISAAMPPRSWFGGVDLNHLATPEAAIITDSTGAVTPTDVTARLALRLTDDIITATDQRLLQATVPTGIFLSSVFGSLEFAQRELAHQTEAVASEANLYQSFACFYGANTSVISNHYHLRGPSGSVVSESCGGMDAIGLGWVETASTGSVMICGACDGSLSPLGLASVFTGGGSVLPPGSEPEQFAPYGRQTIGFIPALGGALVALETRPEPFRVAGHEAVIQVMAQESGYSSGHSVAELSYLIRRVLRQADIGLADIGVCFGNGAGVRAIDSWEAQALVDVFGPKLPPLAVPKTGFGRAYAATSAIDVGLAAACLATGLIPPVARGHEPDDTGPVAAQVVREPTALRRDQALVVNVSENGFMSALVLGRSQPTANRKPSRGTNGGKTSSATTLRGDA
ncbi:MAG: hypothetical protein LBL92_05095 [Propionibacteriaceae bacterium]|jgi:3-oxoacyl-(acyl-carrier-protein) synthase|nr:hypothetical protein [Propionibacteriaceae bacterium]